MEVKAKASYIRISPRKVRLVVDVIRGLSVARARQQLRVMNKAAARPVLKLLESAIANAEHNFHLSSEQLFVKSVAADSGPTLRRWTPKAFGRSAPIRKRTTHISLSLIEQAVTNESAKKERIEKKKTKKVNKTVKK
ncbi:MAG: 50S ribosomal protein L22 [Candidatus Uhrbacteria bacterium GW2011_GWF2_41_16]|uniref:Large ribosomal subunit protein uL22 n=2 Tax=Candidatus Uhriibacteriota TaxID=1752732 RepID=A0A0G0VC29_9BACT|nr:MAG: 50S ribosomal protein L22 [Candidatus Uhrbacteria bacterium GW2011_GWA2_41_10]KKR87523.1 MAG: 50S ribosomal protein L22 [Candidatus Uhrbacteria bacterium GW2011_GWC2_41_11]KKR98503.1 MAG: 50S ribosomal protein L22 [Candidatus Uhrbacteria bacterium GW2011_GWF2_41_16]HBO99961.1 50S ribosomal protein L22 [Candidatus Uhrbacteria bacterium]